MKRHPPEAPSDRLRAARHAAGYEAAGDAARALGVAPPTYYAHENGNRKLTGKSAVAYASAFGVRAEWLLAGEGDAPATNPPAAPSDVPAAPQVGASATESSPSVAERRPQRKPLGYYTLGGRSPRSEPEPQTQSQIQPPIPKTVSVTIPITAEARRGYFVDPNFAPRDLGEVSIELLPDAKSQDYVAFRLADASMDLHYPEGSVVVCRRLPTASAATTTKVAAAVSPTSGDHVAIRTRFAGLIEYVVAEIRQIGPSVELHFRSAGGVLRGTEDFNPDRLSAGHSPNPFIQRQREILGIVVAEYTVISN